MVCPLCIAPMIVMGGAALSYKKKVLMWSLIALATLLTIVWLYFRYFRKTCLPCMAMSAGTLQKPSVLKKKTLGGKRKPVFAPKSKRK